MIIFIPVHVHVWVCVLVCRRVCTCVCFCIYACMRRYIYGSPKPHCFFFPDAQTQYGDHFIVALPYGRADPNGAASDLRLVLINPQPASIMVTMNVSGLLTRSITVNAKASHIEDVIAYMLPDTGVSKDR